MNVYTRAAGERVCSCLLPIIKSNISLAVLVAFSVIFVKKLHPGKFYRGIFQVGNGVFNTEMTFLKIYQHYNQDNNILSTGYQQRKVQARHAKSYNLQVCVMTILTMLTSPGTKRRKE